MLSFAHLSSTHLFSPFWPLQCMCYHSVLFPTNLSTLVFSPITNFVLPLMLNFPCASVVILYKSSFSSNSHAWAVAPVTFTWQCIFNDTAYNVTHMLLLPEATVQLTLDDNTTGAPSGRNSLHTSTIALPLQPLIAGIKSVIPSSDTT